MKERNITVTLKKAREWYNSGNATLKEVALQAFSRDELIPKFKSITTFEKACEALNLNYTDMFYITENIAKISRASAAMFRLNIIRKALNLGQDLHLTKDPETSYTYYPCNPFIAEDSTYDYCAWKKIGEFRNEGKKYHVFGDDFSTKIGSGLGNFNSSNGIGNADANFGFLGCASSDIAKHFSKYFGMLITEAKYGDLEDFKIIN